MSTRVDHFAFEASARVHDDVDVRLAAGMKRHHVADGFDELRMTNDDAHATRLAVFRRELHAGDDVVVPQSTWSGTLVLVPPGRPTEP